MEAIITASHRSSDVLGQFTFAAGALSRTARHPGQVDAEGARFPLPDRGHITLYLTGADRLTGTFLGPRQAVPAAEGTIELRRTR